MKSFIRTGCALLVILTLYCAVGHGDHDAAVTTAVIRQELLLAHWVGGEADYIGPYTRVVHLPMTGMRECQ